MTALLQALSRLSPAASIDSTTWKVLVVFCLAGLVLSLIGGADYSREFVP